MIMFNLFSILLLTSALFSVINAQYYKQNNMPTYKSAGSDMPSYRAGENSPSYRPGHSGLPSYRPGPNLPPYNHFASNCNNNMDSAFKMCCFGVLQERKGLILYIYRDA